MINPSVGTGKNLVTTRVLITERLSANTSNITRYKVRRQLIYKQDFEQKFAKRLAYSSTSADMRRIHAFLVQPSIALSGSHDQCLLCLQ